jgi:hypothetical protein
VEKINYLGIITNADSNNQIDLQERINSANRTYFMLQKIFKNKKKKIKETKIKTK